MKFKIPVISKKATLDAKDNTSTKLTKKKKLQIAILTIIAISVGSILFFNFNQNKTVKIVNKKTAQVVEKKEIIYSTTLDNSIKNKNRELEVAYPLGLHKQTNTVFYAFNIINDLDVITIDPLGEAFPPESQRMNNLPSISLGSSTLAINLDSLPKQNYLIRLVTKSGSELLTTQHYYLSNNPFNRTVRLNNLKSGAYYLQALNLVTHATYISTPFYLNSTGDIVSGQQIGFERIDTENIFGLPENKEIAPLDLDDIPIVLNDRFVTENNQEESPFEKVQ
jgi:hypothetical protein